MRYSLCVLCALIFSLVSCTQNKLEIVNSLVCPVFSYETETSYADFHLAAYIQTFNELGYLKLLQINAEDTGCTWTISDFQYIYSSHGKWAGSSALCIPRKVLMPEGRIKLTAVNADSQTVEKMYNLSYSKQLLSLSYKSFLKAEGYHKVLEEYIVFYDMDGVLICCEAEKNVGDMQKYAEKLPAAVTTRTLWVANDKSYAVLSPPLPLAGKTQKK